MKDMVRFDHCFFQDKSDGTRKLAGLTCHNCKNLKSKSDLIFCSKCNKKRYCNYCIKKW